MNDRGTRPESFRWDELPGDATAGDQAQAIATARELEWLAANDDLAPGPGFADRVMAAIGAEPTPRPVVAAASAARRGAILGVVAAFGDLWRVAWGGGRPFAVRGPAIAVVVLVFAGTLGAGALGVGALSGLVNGPNQVPVATPALSQSPSEPSASPSPTPSPSPSLSPEATESPEASVEITATPRATAHPTAPPTARPTAAPTARPTPTPLLTPTPRPTRTPHPSDSPDPSPHDD